MSYNLWDRNTLLSGPGEELLNQREGDEEGVEDSHLKGKGHPGEALKEQPSVLLQRDLSSLSYLTRSAE